MQQETATTKAKVAAGEENVAEETWTNYIDSIIRSRKDTRQGE